MSSHETEKGSTDPSGTKRTSKHQKKLAVRVAEYAQVGASHPVAEERDTLVGGVDAECLAHGREVADQRMRKEDDEETGLLPL